MRLIKIVLTLIFFGIIGYVDFYIISPMVLPEDICYFHTHPTPLWVEWLYMNPSSNGHPDGSFTHVLLLAGVSWVLVNTIILGVKKIKI